jgi:hypothetical protein
MRRAGDIFAGVIDPVIGAHVGSAVAHSGAINARHGSKRAGHDTRAFRTRNVRGFHTAS